MSKLYRINTNIDTSKVLPQLLINKETPLEGGGFGEYTPSQFWKNIVMQSITMAHPTGNLASLRRTQAIGQKINDAVAADGLLTLNEEDKKYIQGSMDRADKWNNSLEIANSLSVVYDSITNAEAVE